MSLTSKVRRAALEMLQGSSKLEKTEVTTQSTPQPEMPSFVYDDPTMLPPLDEEDARIIAEWEHEYRSYTDGYSHFILRFECISKIHRHQLNPRRLFNTKKHPFWAGVLHIHPESVARLMRQGFDWTAANIVEGQDKFALDCPMLPTINHRGEKCKHMRTYELRSLPGQAKWRGTLSIYAKSRDTILNFDVSEVTADTCLRIAAFDLGVRYIYLASRRSGMKYNAVFKNEPLGEWWLASRKGRSVSRRSTSWAGDSYDDGSSRRMLSLATMTAVTAATMMTVV
jgi:hypothetical protein